MSDNIQVTDEQIDERIAAKIDEDFVNLVKDEKFRRFVWWILGDTGIFRTSYTGNATTYFNEGARNFGLKVMDKVQMLTPDTFTKMIKENEALVDEIRSIIEKEFKQLSEEE